MNRELQTLQSVQGETSNPKIAATAIALDIPLDASRPFTTAIGDGIKGVTVIWNFSGASQDGNTIGAVAKVWNDAKWLRENSQTEVAKIKDAFTAFHTLSQTAQGKMRAFDICKRHDTISNASTAMAATLIALGHPCLGYTKSSDCLFWHFDRAAASDMALWQDHSLHEKLPSAMISYIKCALLNWKTLLEQCVKPELTAIKHGTRTAYVGKNDSQQTQDLLEKLLYRK